VRVSVAPAKVAYSPPDNEVGMLMLGIVAGFASLVTDWASLVSFARSSRVATLFARP